ncbi:MAG TPA: hypothetical protein VFW52_02545 [Candidatus Saccharimonadales bacterium]|nr:hypothetical protein [Candidatus Saccharimonadales bacterium]
MRKLVRAARLLAVIAVVALVAVLVSSVRHPVYSQTANCDVVGQEQCAPLTDVNPCQTERANYIAECNKCIDPQSEDCAEGCVRNDAGSCEPDDSTTPDDPQDPPAQVLGATISAEDTGK